MAFFGLLCLGLFVGGIIGMGFVEDSASPVTDADGKIVDPGGLRPQGMASSGKAVKSLLGAAIGGGLGAFIQLVEAPIGEAVFAYPVGLLLGFIWPFVKGSWCLVRDAGGLKGIKDHPVAALHVGSILFVSAATLLLVIVPNVRELIMGTPALG
ncbi:MAG: hypothetical protein AAFM92_09130 [Pseudomonadota bacterium]